MNDETAHEIGGWLRLLALLLVVWEPLSFAVVAAGAFNAISIRGLPVVLVLLARFATTALCVVAGRAILDRRAAAPALARAALVLSPAVQIFAATTPYFPSNRLPGQTPLYVGWTVMYYGVWLLYLMRSRRAASMFR